MATANSRALGMIGLGRMGGNMAERLRRGGHTVIGYDRAPDSARDVDSLEALAAKLPTPRVVWVMVPAGPPTYETIETLGKQFAGCHQVKYRVIVHPGTVHGYALPDRDIFDKKAAERDWELIFAMFHRQIPAYAR